MSDLMDPTTIMTAMITVMIITTARDISTLKLTADMVTMEVMVTTEEDAASNTFLKKPCFINKR